MTLLGYKTILHKKCRSGKNCLLKLGCLFQVLWLIDPDCGLHMTKRSHPDFLKFVFILLDIGPTPRNFLLDPLNFCRTYIFYVKLFYSQATSYRYYYFSLAEHFVLNLVNFSKFEGIPSWIWLLFFWCMVSTFWFILDGDRSSYF
jgi:hypothetical protein